MVYTYKSPMTDRYGSDEMRYIFSDRNRHVAWRLLWVDLACIEHNLGLDITKEQMAEMAMNVCNIDYDKVREYEAETKHDVMAHLKEFCDRCPSAEPIIHLGATSCYVTDNADILIMDEALELIQAKLIALIDKMATFAEKHAGNMTMAYTHLQPAQPTTVGKRGCMWIQDFMMDLDALHSINLKLLGCKGATGTQASFLELLKDKSKVEQMDELLGTANNHECLPISGQTYTRKIDSIVLDALSGIAQSAHKMCNDIRLLQGMHEMCEPFSEKQVGSSAMAYKQNPIKCENVCSLSRHVVSITMTAKMNACTQWLERSLDDSANRRIVIPESFILIDHIIDQCIAIISGLRVNGGIISEHINNDIPFLMMENIIMDAVNAGVSRQEAHSRIRDLSAIATENVLNGMGNNLLDLIAGDELFHDIDIDTNPYRLMGMAKEQTTKYLKTVREKLGGIVCE